jgi:hypothetical protein
MHTSELFQFCHQVGSCYSQLSRLLQYERGAIGLVSGERHRTVQSKSTFPQWIVLVSVHLTCVSSVKVSRQL